MALEQRNRVEAGLEQIHASDSYGSKENKDPLVEHHIQAI